MKRWNRWIAAALVGGLALGAGACSGSNKPGAEATATGDKPPAEIGAALYPATPLKPTGDIAPQADPIIVPNAVVQNDLRVQVAAQVEGTVEMIATPFEGQFNPNDPEIVFHPRDKQKKQPYRRLRENDIVKKDQELARLDEQLVDLTIRLNEALVEATDRAIVAASQAEKSQQEQLETTMKVAGASKLEVLNLQSLVARYIENRIQAEKEKAKVFGELQQAKAKLRQYFVTSPINGRVVKILKSPQEFAKAGETILEIQATDVVRVEGKMDVQYAQQIRRGMRVLVEPARPVGPNALSNFHRMEVTSIAVTAHKGRPMIVSGGLDATALVWDVTATKQSHRLPHPAGVGVRSVACTESAAAKNHLVATGTEDGIIRLWDITDPSKLPKEPLATFEEKHGGAIVALVFSPDGKYLASASGRDVFVWDVSARKKKYSLPGEHNNAVTAVRFTPQATLVTAARDKSIRVWKLGEVGANVVTHIDHRGGSVDALGVSADGSKVLFDKDPSRIDVVSLSDERTVGTMQSPGGGARFATLAQFSPNGEFILTAGGDADQRGELTLWASPQAGGRASEMRRLVTPQGSAVTCAAFSGDAEKPLIACGTSEGRVHFWLPPSAEDRGKTMTGEIVFVQQVDARSLAVRVELPNPVDKAGDGGLPDRSLATIIIPPGGVAAAIPAPPVPGAGVIRPAAAGNEPGGIIPAGGAGTPGPVSVAPPALPPVTVPPPPMPPTEERGLSLPPVTSPKK